jgi:hypothetical protein
LKELFPDGDGDRAKEIAKSQRDEVSTLFKNDDTATSKTAYAGLKAVVYWTDHEKKGHNVYIEDGSTGKDKLKRKIDERAMKENEVMSILFSTKDKLKEKAYVDIKQRVNAAV